MKSVYLIIGMTMKQQEQSETSAKSFLVNLVSIKNKLLREGWSVNEHNRLSFKIKTDKHSDNMWSFGIVLSHMVHVKNIIVY